MKMKHIFLVLGLLCLAGICHAQRLALSVEQSTLNWTGRAAVGSYRLSGTLEAEGGFVELGAGVLERGKVVVDMSSMASETDGLCTHLRKKDFFWVKKHPKATFELKEACPLVEGAGQLEGWLTLRGVRKLVEMPVAVAFEKGALELHGKLVLDRTAYGMRYNSPSFFADLGNQAIADEMEIEVHLVFGNL